MARTPATYVAQETGAGPTYSLRPSASRACSTPRVDSPYSNEAAVGAMLRRTSARCSSFRWSRTPSTTPLSGRASALASSAAVTWPRRYNVFSASSTSTPAGSPVSATERGSGGSASFGCGCAAAGAVINPCTACVDTIRVRITTATGLPHLPNG